jgi:hypothetical protein
MQTDSTAETQRSALSRLVASVEQRFPFLGAQLVVLAAILLDLSLSHKLTVGPTWLLPALEGVLLVALVIASPHPRVRHSPMRRRVSVGLVGLVSLANIVSLLLLSHYLLKGGKENGHALVGSGIVLWATNVLLFGLWYWEVDRGGPVERARRTHTQPDFLFTQMTDERYSPRDWMPGLVDYLYVSFTNATAFSPTDTMPLTQTAKWMMSIQAMAALLTVLLIFSRAISVLT